MEKLVDHLTCQACTAVQSADRILPRQVRPKQYRNVHCLNIQKDPRNTNVKHNNMYSDPSRRTLHQERYYQQ